MKDENFFINEDWLCHCLITGSYAIPICKVDEIKELITKLTELSAELKATK